MNDLLAAQILADHAAGEHDAPIDHSDGCSWPGCDDAYWWSTGMKFEPFVTTTTGVPEEEQMNGWLAAVAYAIFAAGFLAGACFARWAHNSRRIR